MPKCAHAQTLHEADDTPIAVICRLTGDDCRYPCSQYRAQPRLPYRDDALRSLICVIIRRAMCAHQWDVALWWCEAWGMDIRLAAQMINQARQGIGRNG